MHIIKGNLAIRNAEEADAAQLCAWWNDGSIMAHAGFPNGLNTTPEDIRRSLATDDDGIRRRHIIEIDGKPAGEMNYRNKGGNTAEIGIKICETSHQGKGYGTVLLALFIDALFFQYGYETIVLDTNVRNKRAQHVYEQKLGFCVVRKRHHAWRDQLGEWQSSIDYALTRDAWLQFTQRGAAAGQPGHRAADR